MRGRLRRIGVTERRFGDVIYRSGRWPRGWCEAVHVNDGLLWRCYAWREKAARREARDLAVAYGYWPSHIRIGVTQQQARAGFVAYCTKWLGES